MKRWILLVIMAVVLGSVAVLIFMGFSIDRNTPLPELPNAMVYDESDIFLGNAKADTTGWYPCYGYRYVSVGFKVCKVARNTVTGVDTGAVQAYVEATNNSSVATSKMVIDSIIPITPVFPADTVYRIRGITLTGYYKIRVRYVATNGHSSSTDSALVIDRRTILSK